MNNITDSVMPLGLLELDATGRVLLYEPIREHNSCPSPSDIIGRNFFTDVAPVAELREFQIRFNAFMANGESTHRCAISVPSKHGHVQVQFLLAHISEQAAFGLKRMALVQIKPESSAISPNALYHQVMTRVLESRVANRKHR